MQSSNKKTLDSFVSQKIISEDILGGGVTFASTSGLSTNEALARGLQSAHMNGDSTLILWDGISYASAKVYNVSTFIQG